jgi:hypothetical protein
VRRDEEVEEQAGNDVGTAVVVTRKTDEDSVLLQVHNHQSQVRDDCYSLAIAAIVGSTECILRTKIMRFLKPTKLGVFSASWLRHEVREDACVAKT